MLTHARVRVPAAAQWGPMFDAASGQIVHTQTREYARKVRAHDPIVAACIWYQRLASRAARLRTLGASPASRAGAAR